MPPSTHTSPPLHVSSPFTAPSPSSSSSPAGGWPTVYLPGPTEVRPEVLAAMQRQMIPHRGEEAAVLFERVCRGLQPLFGTTQPVYVATSAATGMMEAAIRSGTRRRVLALVGGAFGERFAAMAEACGREVTRLVVEPGRAVTPEAVEAALGDGHGYDAVTVTHVETATGACTDIAGIAERVRARDDVMLLVDGVTSVGGASVGMDAWGVDLVFSASQKALAVPPGLAFAACSPRLLERARTLPDRGMYLDLVRYDEAARRNAPISTPAMSLVYALEAQLRIVEREGLDARLQRHMSMARLVWRWVYDLAALGLPVTVLAPHGERAPTVTCVTWPGDAREVVTRMRDRHGILIGGGYGDLAPLTFRIGHMGEHTVAGVERVLALLSEELRDLSRTSRHRRPATTTTNGTSTA
jgi:aspartate aminotransferase-like enzyme